MMIKTREGHNARPGVTVGTALSYPLVPERKHLPERSEITAKAPGASIGHAVSTT